MKDSMGIYHSSLNCERFAMSFQNCFGLTSSSDKPYQDESDQKSESVDGSLCNGNSVKSSTHQAFVENSTSKRRYSRKSSCTKDCCYKSSEADTDDFPYNLCSQSNESQLTSSAKCTRTNSSSSIQPYASLISAECKTNNNLSETSQKTKQTANCRHSVSSDIIEDRTKTSTVFVNANGVATRTIVNTNSDLEQRHSINSAGVPTLTEVAKCNKLNSISQDRKSADKDFTPSDSRMDCVAEMKNVVSENIVIEDLTVPAETTRPEKNAVDVTHFRNLVTSETSRLNQSIDSWNVLMANDSSHCPQEVSDEIRTVIGQTRLVISERFTQFTALIDRVDGKGKSAKDDRPVLLSDLQGFWDMIYFQVQDVDAKFDSLEKLRLNKWKDGNMITAKKVKTDSVTPKKAQPKRPAKKQPAKKNKSQMSEEDKKRRDAARRRLAEARKALAQRNQVEQDSSSSATSTPKPDVAVATFITETNHNDNNSQTNYQSSSIESSIVLKKRPESIVDAISCAVAVSHVNPEAPAITSISSTSLVH